ncbi:MAG: SHOCT domain-containing protein [Lacisediminihabitans sp.]
MLSTLAHTGLATYWGGPMGFMGGGFGFLFLLIPLFWIGIFFLIFGVIGRRWRRAGAGAAGHCGHGYPASQARSAEASLAERFAQGDIEEKEYRARLEVLRVNNPHQPPLG